MNTKCSGLNKTIAFVLSLIFVLTGCTSRPDGTMDKPKLTIEKVKELAEKGEDLTWSDFEQYKDEGDVGFGLYILSYDIDEKYCLRIGGGSLQEPPMYIRLVSKADSSKCIDIQTESIDDFINSLGD